tara:strand:- start:7496 stop:7657 length:162 start_codon:yes stop_codon:yes gene_type:complete
MGGFITVLLAYLSTLGGGIVVALGNKALRNRQSEGINQNKAMIEILASIFISR